MKRRGVVSLFIAGLAGCNTETNSDSESTPQSSTSANENVEFGIVNINPVHYGMHRHHELWEKGITEKTSAGAVEIDYKVSNQSETRSSYQVKIRVNDTVVKTVEDSIGGGLAGTETITVEFDGPGQKQIAVNDSTEHTIEIIDTDTSWPMTGHSRTNDRSIPRDSGPITGEVRRRWELSPNDGPFRGEPVVSPDYGAAYIGDSENLYSIDIATGDINWFKTESDAQGIAYLAIHDDELIYTVDGGEDHGPTKLKAVSLDGNETRWEIEPENSTWRVYGRPIITDRRIVVPGYDTTLLFTRDTQEMVDSIPRKSRGLLAERDGMLYLPSGEVLVKYDMERGEIVWEHTANTKGGKISAPLVHGDHVFFGTTEAEMGTGNEDSSGNKANNTALFAVDDADGSRVFLDNDYHNKRLTVAGIRSPPLIADDRLRAFAMDPRTYRTYAFRDGMDSLELEIAKRSEDGLGSFYDTTESNGVLYHLQYDRVFATDHGGTTIWSHYIDPGKQRTSAVSIGGPVVTEGKLLVAQGGVLFCLEAA